MRTEVIDKLAALITAAFGLVAALAWNDTIKLIFTEIFGETGNLTGMLIYAFVVTFIAVFATIQIGKISERAKKDEDKKNK